MKKYLFSEVLSFEIWMRNPGQGVEKGKRDCVMMANLKFCQNT
jgi:hypothetical protein